MKRSILFLIALLWVTLSVAQQYEEVVYLKNGSRIKGKVVETTPERVKIEIYDGSILIYSSSEIEKIAKESTTTSRATHIQRQSKERTTKVYRTPGYCGFLDAGYAMRTSDVGLEYAHISTAHGYQFNPYLFTGLGAGAQFVTGARYGTELNTKTTLYQDFDGSDVGAIVFANVRGYLLNNKISPYLDFRIGYATATKGMYLQPTIGVAFGKFDLGVGLGCQQIKYLYEEVDDEYTSPNKTSENQKLELNVSFRVGVNF